MHNDGASISSHLQSLGYMHCTCNSSIETGATPIATIVNNVECIAQNLKTTNKIRYTHISTLDAYIVKFLWKKGIW